MSKQGRGPSAPGKKRIDPLTVIIRPNSFAPQLFQSSIDVTQAPTSGTTSIIPKTSQPSLFGGNPFGSEAVSPPATPGGPSAETAGTTGPRFRKIKKRPQMTASTTAQAPAVIDRIHNKVVGAKESKRPDTAPVVEVPSDAPEAVPFKVVKKRKKKSSFRCTALNVVMSRLQAWTGVGAGRAWKLLNPVSTTLAKHLLLTGKDILRLRAAFNLIDVDGSATVDFDEFFEIFYQVRTPFSDAVFTLIDDPASLVRKIPEDERAKLAAETGVPSLRVRGKLSFDDYFQVCCLYCILSREEILRFSFDSFDLDKSGSLEAEEYKTLVAVVNNFNPMYPGNFQVAMSQFDLNNDGKISYDEFKYLNFKFPMVLFPAFQLQDDMQAITLGLKRWVRVHEMMKARHYFMQYMQVHNGGLPLQSCWTVTKACGKDKRYKMYDLPLPGALQERKPTTQDNSDADAAVAPAPLP